MDEELKQQMVERLDIGELAPAEQDEIITKIGENILKQLTITVLDKLPEEDLPEFDTITESGDPARLQEFLSSKIPNYNKLMQEETTRIIDEFKEIRRGLETEEAKNTNTESATGEEVQSHQ